MCITSSSAGPKSKYHSGTTPPGGSFSLAPPGGVQGAVYGCMRDA